MPALTRRSQDHHQECWHVYCGAVYVGTIVRRIGNPHDTEPWEWRCPSIRTRRPHRNLKLNLMVPADCETYISLTRSGV